MKRKRKLISFFFHFSKGRSIGGMKVTGKNPSTREKICPSTTLTTNPTWTHPGSNPGLRFRCISSLHLQNRIILPWRRRKYISPKCWYLSTRLHDTKFQEIIIFITGCVTTQCIVSLSYRLRVQILERNQKILCHVLVNKIRFNSIYKSKFILKTVLH
jgi:hypothetical protein